VISTELILQSGSVPLMYTHIARYDEKSLMMQDFSKHKLEEASDAAFHSQTVLKDAKKNASSADFDKVLSDAWDLRKRCLASIP